MKPFQLLIKPAAGDCNLGCEYCFYRDTTPGLYPETKKHRMSLDLMERMVKDLLSHRFPESIFCWQGGEPSLMGREFFEAVVETQIKQGKGGQTVGNAFQTNGTLIDREFARFLARYKFVVGLSLDGPREIHDRYRKNLADEGTFERVMGAADLLRSEGVTFNILAVVNRFSEERARDTYRFFRAHGFDYIQYIPCLEPDPRTGEVTEFSATPEGLGKFWRELFDEYRRDGFPRVSERTFDALLNLRLTGDSGVCTFGPECGGYLVVEHNGDIYPCDFFVEEKWKLGNLTEKPLHEFMSHPLMKTFAAAKKRRPPECADCSDLGSCHGGCLKDRLPGRASAPGKTLFCAGYRELFAATGRQMDEWTEEIAARSRRDSPAPGRNDPCPCGSGSKFKHCHGKNAAAKETA